MSSNNFKNRQYVRIKTVFPVEFCFVENVSKTISSDVFQSFTSNISKGGIAIEIQSPSAKLLKYLEVETYRYLFSLKIMPPFFKKKPILAFAKVVWQKKSSANGNDALLLGLRYVEILESDRKKLYKYVNALRRKPYEIGIFLVIILVFLVYLFFDGQYFFVQNKSLKKNLSSLKTSLKTQEKQCLTEQQEKKELYLQLKEALKQKEHWKKKINTISQNTTSQKREKIISKLKQTTSSLRENLNLLNKENSNLKKKLLTLNQKTYGLLIEGSDICHKIDNKKIIDILTLNSRKILSGQVKEDSNKLVSIKTTTEETYSFHPKDVSSVIRLTCVDYHKYTQSKSQKNLNQFSNLTDRDTRIELLKKIQYDCFKYFLHERNKETGLVKENSLPNSAGSIAATGFAILTYCIAHQKGWLNKEETFSMILTILKTVQNQLDNQKGFYYKFVDVRTGKRIAQSEISSLDTAIFIGAALTAGEYFAHSQITTVAEQLYENIDWIWMTNNKNALAMSWNPEVRFLPYYWYTYNEGLLAYILAIGAPKKNLSRMYWDKIERPVGHYKDYHFVYSQTGSLYVYQYPHLFVNFKNINDNGLNHWNNTVKAIQSNHQFCVDNQKNYPLSYSKNLWGLTACKGPRGFDGYGAKPGVNFHDGTIAPSAIIASLPFTPQLSWASLKYLYNTYGNMVYGFYGFKDALNLELSWFSDEYIGINKGLSFVMIENYFSEFVWKYFMKTKAFKNWKFICLHDS